MNPPRTRRKSSTPAAAAADGTDERKRPAVKDPPPGGSSGDRSSSRNGRGSSKRSSSANLRSTTNSTEAVVERRAPSRVSRRVQELQSENENNQPSSVGHFTRSKNDTLKQGKRPLSDDEEEELMAIDECAALLAGIDIRAYQRALLRDANAILERILVPMSFPWTHRDDPLVKPISCDIDEMPGIQSVGNEVHEDGSLGKFEEISDERLPRNTQAAARRSEDPGVIDFTTVYHTTLAQREKQQPVELYDPEDDDVAVPGELSFRLFREVQARKKRRLDMERSNTKARQVSIRLASSSSRKTIFASNPEDELSYLLLPAMLPPEVQEGKRMYTKAARAVAEKLGSYDLRAGRGDASHESKSRRPRVHTGRTRIMWTVKEGMAPKISFRSILTREKLEKGEQKRPRAVKVGIRLNGSLLKARKDVVQKYENLLVENLMVDVAVGQPFAYANKIVVDAIATACKDPPRRVHFDQCTLNGENLWSRIRNERLETKDDDANACVKAQKRFQIQWDTSEPSSQSLSIRVVPPKVDCLPSEDGILDVVCTDPGRLEGLNSEDVPDEKAIARMMDESAAQMNVCTICRTKSPYDDVMGCLLTCSGCGLVVHDTCYGAGASSGDSWQCEACDNAPSSCQTESSRRDFRWGLKCELCPQRGGAFVRRQGAWVHSVCLMWCDQQPPSPSLPQVDLCALCSKSSGITVPCAARNCGVRFHPMCALVSSRAVDLSRKQGQKLSDWSAKSADEKASDWDTYLCSQYTLSMAHVSCFGGVIPLALCGYHNPKRSKDRAGLYPGGCYLDGAMRIPPRRREVPIG